MKLTLTVLTISICFAFTSKNNDGLSVTYGVCKEDPFQIELKLNSDYTFTYQDFSIRSQKIKVQGTYQIKNNKVQLMTKDSQIEFHDKWKIVDDGTTAKSRKGLTFYTLRKK
ncbi:MAG: hypothetical protein WDZ35_04855 [Crocinitomicaceae bacterium]